MISRSQPPSLASVVASKFAALARGIESRPWWRTAAFPLHPARYDSASVTADFLHNPPSHAYAYVYVLQLWKKQGARVCGPSDFQYIDFFSGSNRFSYTHSCSWWTKKWNSSARTLDITLAEQWAYLIILLKSIFLKNILNKINSSKNLQKRPHQFAACNFLDELVLSSTFLKKTDFS